MGEGGRRKGKGRRDGGGTKLFGFQVTKVQEMKRNKSTTNTHEWRVCVCDVITSSIACDVMQKSCDNDVTALRTWRHEWPFVPVLSVQSAIFCFRYFQKIYYFTSHGFQKLRILSCQTRAMFFVHCFLSCFPNLEQFFGHTRIFLDLKNWLYALYYWLHRRGTYM